MTIRYALVLDSGTWLSKSFRTRAEAKAEKDRRNRIAREQKERGDLVSLRYVIGIARYDEKKLLAVERERIAANLKPRRRKRREAA